MWSSMSKANLGSILKLQKTAARAILSAPFDSRSLDLFNTLNWIPFYRESHINRCVLIHKRLKGNTPNNMNELLVTNPSMHIRNLNLLWPRNNYATEGVVLLQFVLSRIATLYQEL